MTHCMRAGIDALGFALVLALLVYAPKLGACVPRELRECDLAPIATLLPDKIDESCD